MFIECLSYGGFIGRDKEVLEWFMPYKSLCWGRNRYVAKEQYTCTVELLILGFVLVLKKNIAV